MSIAHELKTSNTVLVHIYSIHIHINILIFRPQLHAPTTPKPCGFHLLKYTHESCSSYPTQTHIDWIRLKNNLPSSVLNIPVISEWLKNICHPLDQLIQVRTQGYIYLVRGHFRCLRYRFIRVTYHILYKVDVNAM